MKKLNFSKLKMGAAESKNTTNLLTNVTNQVTQSTSNVASQAGIVNNSISFRGCTLKASGGIDIKQAASVTQQSSQINKSIQNSAVQNDIAQKVAQSAASKVGSLGLGYASANNTVNATVNATSLISQNLSNSSSQYSNSGNRIDCNNSTFISGGGINIGQENTASTLSSQMEAGSQTSSIENQISQSVTQKATATVEGLGGLLLAIACIIAALGYTIAKPFTTGSAKILIVVMVVVVIAVVLALMYIRSTPPFFSELPMCQPPETGGFVTCNSTCVDPSDHTLTLDAPPLKYTYSIIGASPVAVGGANVNLARQVINSMKDGTFAGSGGSSGTAQPKGQNGGYTKAVYDQLTLDMASITAALKTAGIASKWQAASPTTRPYIVPIPLMMPQITNRPSMYGYSIPVQYRNEPSSTDASSGICTPAAITEIDEGSDSTTCGTYVAMTACPVQPANSVGSIGCAALTAAAVNDDAAYVLATWNATDFATFPISGSIPDQNSDWNIARFVYTHLYNQYASDMTGIAKLAPNNIGVDDDEPVESIHDGTIMTLKAAMAAGWAYKFVPKDGAAPSHGGLSVGGTIQGTFGFCESNTYKLNKALRTWGWKVLLGVFGAIMAFVILKPGEKKEEGVVEEGEDAVEGEGGEEKK